MDEYFGISRNEIDSVIIATALVFLAIILLTRVFGKRSFSKMSSFDFASTIAIGSIIASGILLKDVTPLKAIIALSTIFGLQTGIAYFRRFDFVHNIIDNRPLLLMVAKTILFSNLKKARVTEADLRSKLRASNIINLDHVRAVVLESTGDLSIISSSDPDAELQEWFIQDVER